MQNRKAFSPLLKGSVRLSLSGYLTSGRKSGRKVRLICRFPPFFDISPVLIFNICLLFSCFLLFFAVFCCFFLAFLDFLVFFFCRIFRYLFNVCLTSARLSAHFYANPSRLLRHFKTQPYAVKNCKTSQNTAKRRDNRICRHTDTSCDTSCNTSCDTPRHAGTRRKK